MRNILAVISFACLFTSLAFAAVEVVNPMEFAERISIDHSMGDVEDQADWKGCVYTRPSSLADLAIRCHGTLASLVYGNRPLIEPFECIFEFKKSQNAESYIVVKRYCE